MSRELAKALARSRRNESSVQGSLVGCLDERPRSIKSLLPPAYSEGVEVKEATDDGRLVDKVQTNGCIGLGEIEVPA